MESVSVSEAARRLGQLVEQVGATNEPILVAGTQTECVLVPSKLWEGIQETLFLLSVPGLRDALKDGMQTPPGECFDEPSW